MRAISGPSASPGATAAVLLGLLLAPGCRSLERVLGVEGQLAAAGAMARIEGTIATELPAEGPLVVVLARAGDAQGEALVGVDTFVRVRPGRFSFLVAPGRYRLGAYEDRNQNGRLDPGERTRAPRDGRALAAEAGGVAREDIVLARDATSPATLTHSVDVFDLVARTPREQVDFSLWAWSVQGQLCESLDDPRFGREAGTRGLWELADFASEGLAGVYFREPYDRRRIPVLFVHGLGGFPQELGPLMDSLDRTRFQAWFYFYPSGAPLDSLSTHLAALLARLQVKHGFDRIAVVAHSMGGLVARGAILKYWEETRRNDVRLFVAISTPWGGDVQAERIEASPVELPPALADMDPSSDYLRWLFWRDEGRSQPRRLPSSVELHLVIGFHMPGRARVASDGTVSLASQTRREAQEEAASLRALDYGHVDILRSPEAHARLQQLLARRFP